MGVWRRRLLCFVGIVGCRFVEKRGRGGVEKARLSVAFQERLFF